MPPPLQVTVRPATPRDRLDVRRILDGAMLEVGDVEAHIEAGDVFVATEVQQRERGRDQNRDQEPDTDTDRILGALVCESRDLERDARAHDDDHEKDAHGHPHAHISAIAVRRRQRARGVGTALVEHVLEREGALTARFDESVRPFYDSLGFSITQIAERRYEGRRRRSE
ncbi:GNAT family N-acetyltransferase [Halobacteria archaeon AArc-m2/3/4]|uniref:GNAT family N-acetyltransferase n=1 Tax=Natronoglomus mannanivorans TaxID=2979990 RepID=A0AAP2Z0I1_9EURY|nr:GNAT family N-acetyltransferase [Halobacteria archaeon AArc-xg1-1]MCU4971963.1 GNAT family N-acetyltransferase [Halobacteria archaeon AArc-m2/3/4]